MSSQYSHVAHHAGPPASRATPGECDAAHTLRVLVVDDEMSIRMLLMRLLKEWGYSVRHVGSAVEALAVMAVEPADIILCDIGMPDHDGLSLAARVHAQSPLTAIIMCTGRQDADTVQTSRKVGAVAYVTKPFDLYMLRQALEQASGR